MLCPRPTHRKSLGHARDAILCSHSFLAVLLGYSVLNRHGRIIVSSILNFPLAFTACG